MNFDGKARETVSDGIFGATIFVWWCGFGVGGFLFGEFFIGRDHLREAMDFEAWILQRAEHESFAVSEFSTFFIWSLPV